MSLVERARALLIAGDWASLEALALAERRTLSVLTALTYEQDPLLAWRAVDGFGRTAALLAADDPEFVRGHLRRLLWLVNDESGGIGWRAPEALGAALARCPQTFKEFIPLLLSLLDMEAEQDAARFRPGVLWALAQLAEAAPESVRPAVRPITHCLHDPNQTVRGLAVLCLGRLEHTPPELLALADDPARLEIYQQGRLQQTSVSQLVRTAAP